MLRFTCHVAVALIGSALALLLAAWFVPGVTLRASGFLVAVGVFAACQAILAPIVFSFARKYAQGLIGGIGIISTLLALIIADIIPDGLGIEGWTAWIVTPLLVWFITGFGGWIVTALVIDKWLQRRKDEKAIRRVQGQNHGS